MQHDYGNSLNPRKLASALSPKYYLQELGIEPYPWQVFLHESYHTHKRVALLCARQAGKSHSVAGEAGYTAKNYPGTLSLITAPSQDQSTYTMRKVRDMISVDRELSDMQIASSKSEKEFSNGSQILALPGSEKSVRGYSQPRLIIFDEAARVLDETYRATRPMLTKNPDARMMLITTPFGKQGFFHNVWEYGGDRWLKILVVPGFTLEDGRIVEREPEEDFQREMLKKGIHAFYSPRHTREFLEEELDDLGSEFWFRQEYLCEFLDAATSMFSSELINRAMSPDVKPLFEGANAVTDTKALIL